MWCCEVFLDFVVFVNDDFVIVEEIVFDCVFDCDGFVVDVGIYLFGCVDCY